MKDFLNLSTKSNMVFSLIWRHFISPTTNSMIEVFFNSLQLLLIGKSLQQPNSTLAVKTKQSFNSRQQTIQYCNSILSFLVVRIVTVIKDTSIEISHSWEKSFPGFIIRIRKGEDPWTITETSTSSSLWASSWRLIWQQSISNYAILTNKVSCLLIKHCSVNDSRTFYHSGSSPFHSFLLN